MAGLMSSSGSASTFSSSPSAAAASRTASAAGGRSVGMVPRCCSALISPPRSCRYWRSSRGYRSRSAGSRADSRMASIITAGITGSAASWSSQVLAAVISSASVVSGWSSAEVFGTDGAPLPATG